MNPDAYRDSMDRSSNPYEGGQDIIKVTAGLDELSLKKQLPLRQQANKPMFKYNTNRTQSVHLFNQGDVGLIGRGEVNNYSNGLYYTGNVNAPHQVLSIESTAPSHAPPQHQRMSSNGNTTKRNPNTPTTSNPYVRPVSATEVAANVNGEKARKMVESTIAVVSEKTSADISGHSSLQRNSFLRPLSGIGGKDKSSSRKQTQSPSDPHPSQLQRKDSTGSESSFKQYNESKAIMKSKFQFASTASTPLVSNNIMKNSNSQVPINPIQSSNVSPINFARNSECNPNKPYREDSFNKPDTYTHLTAQSFNAPKESYLHNRDDNLIGQDANRSNNGQEYFTKWTLLSRKSSLYIQGLCIRPLIKYSDGSLQKVVPDDSPKNSEVATLKKMPVTNTLTGSNLYYRKTSLTDTSVNRAFPHSSSFPSSLSNQSHNGVHAAGPRPSDPHHHEDSVSTYSEGPNSSRSVVTSKPPLNRPAFERSNASIQLNHKPLIQDKKITSGNHRAENSDGKGGKSGGPRQTVGSTERTLSNLSVNNLPPRHNALSSLKKPKTLSTLEHRPKADGAPAKNTRTSDKKRVLSIPAKNHNPHWDEEDEDDEDVESYDNFGDDCEEGSENTPSGERLPGDGEDSFDEFADDGEEEEVLDNFEGSLSDGESDGYSIHSRSSADRRSANGRPMTSQSAGAADKTDELLGDKKGQQRPATASNVVVKPALKTSLFKHIPPTVNFVADGEKAEQLPWELRKLLKWKMSPITPIVVKRAVGRAGFRISKRNHDWLGCFGKHMKAQCFKSLREYQKLNHFPGSFQIGRKDRLWRNLSRCQVHFGKKEFNFFPHTYCLPQDLKLLKRAWEDGNSKQKWIIKPPASARGIGIKVISKWSQIPRRKPVIVQKYLARPYLINDSKFDMRIYVYISSYDPLRIYVYDDGLARFASCKYSSSMKSLNNRYMHLTNYSVNKKNNEYVNNTDDSITQGHKWSLKALWNYMKRQGINTTLIWDNIRDLIIKTIICGDSPINSMTKSNSRSRYVCHELFGFDVLLDENYKPWILEVNISPSLHSNSQLDINVKGGMIKDLMNIAGFRIPDERDVTSNGSNTDFSSHVPLNKFCMDKRLFTNQLAPDERAKHAYYCQKHQDEQIMQSILDIITPDDMRILCESIDEDSRKGNFQRLFPTPHTHRYLRYFEQPRYYNLLLDQWVLRYNRMEQRGILLLQSFCEEKIHLENPTSNSRHQWAPPNSTMASLRAADARPVGPGGSLNSARGSAWI